MVSPLLFSIFFDLFSSLSLYYYFSYICKETFSYLEKEEEKGGHIIRSSPSSPDIILTPLRSVPNQADDGFATGKLT